MLKQGLMRVGGAEYTVYELRADRFFRLDIMKKGGRFHEDVSSVLFSCFGIEHFKRYGDMPLFQKYADAVFFLRKIRGRKTSESQWEGGIFIHTVENGIAGRRKITQTRNCEWYGEIYEYDGTSIVMRMLDASFKMELIPSNDSQYSYGKTGYFDKYRRHDRAEAIDGFTGNGISRRRKIHAI